MLSKLQQINKQSFSLSKQSFSLSKTTFILILSLVILLGGGFFAYQHFFNSGPVEEMDLSFDAEGPYALLLPRRDGNALVLNLKRTASYDAITYELAYTSFPDETKVEGGKEQTVSKGKVVDEDGENSSAKGTIDRGVVGTIDTKQKKGEYEQEILLGTCSKNVCKYDKGVENGTLTLHIKKGRNAYRMITQWHLQKPDVALGSLTSGDGHFIYKVSADRTELTNIGYSIVNDLTGVPKLPVGKQVSGKVYSLNGPVAKDLPGGDVSVELADNPDNDAKLARYSEKDNRWIVMDTKISGSKLSGKADSGGIFAVLVNKK